MTAEEIKDRVSMRDILAERGIEVNRNMCRCPFHGHDRHPSMQVFKDGCKCYTCNESYDIFSFVMKYDSCDFKTAFVSLGGTYENYDNDRARIVAKIKRESAKAERYRAKETNGKMYKAISTALDICRMADKVFPPYSDDWCFLKNEFPIIAYMYEERVIKGEIREWSDIDVFRRCEQIIKRYLVKA